MSLSTISTSPTSKFNWADDDDDDDFDFDTWKATADISAPSAESLGPLNFEGAAEAEPTPTIHYDTLSKLPPNKEAPCKNEDAAASVETTPAITARKIVNAILENMDQYDGKMCTAWRALRDDLPAPPAYPELNAWESERKGYAQEWKAMKQRSGWDGKCGPTLYRFSPLCQDWETTSDGLVEAYNPEMNWGLEDAEEVCGGEEVETAVPEKHVGVVGDMAPFDDYHDEDMVTRIELPLQDIEVVDVYAPFIVSSPMPPTDMEASIKDIELLAPIVPADYDANYEEFDIGASAITSSLTTGEDIEVSSQDGDMASSIEPVISCIDSEKTASPLIVSSPAFITKAQETSQDGDEIPPQPTTDNEEGTALSSSYSSSSELDDAFLSDSSSDADSESTSISSVSLPPATFTITIPTRNSKKLPCSSPTPSANSSPLPLSPISKTTQIGLVPVSTSPSSSPPLPVIYDATRIGLSPVSDFIRHKHHDSQEVLQHSVLYASDMDELEDHIDDVLDPSTVTHPLANEIEPEEHKENLKTYVCDQATRGWGHLWNMSWTTTTAVIGVGIALGCCLRAARR